MNVTVYTLPERVDLAPLPPWIPAGDRFNLSCQVAGGSPQNSLTVVLLRGEEELRRQPFGEDPTWVTVTAQKEDHRVSFSCRAELDLRPRGLNLFQTNSDPQQLRTFVLTEPNLVTPKVVEVGTPRPVSCSFEGLFPVSDAKVNLELGGQELRPNISYNEETLQAKVDIEGQQEGEQELKCEVTLGGQSRQKTETVTFYNFPAPILTLTDPEVREGLVVTVDCKAQNGTLVTLREAPDTPPSPRVQFSFNASAEHHGRPFLCRATLEVAGHKVHKDQSQHLRVLYGPRLNDNDCPGKWTWDAGSHQTLRCQPWGNPTPKLECRRKSDGAPLPIGDLKPVRAEILGTYVCQASSPLKTVSREVVVEVISPDYTLPIVLVLITLVILTGALGTACYINRQRKMQKYELQKAQEALKLNETRENS